MHISISVLEFPHEYNGKTSNVGWSPKTYFKFQYHFCFLSSCLNCLHLSLSVSPWSLLWVSIKVSCKYYISTYSHCLDTHLCLFDALPNWLYLSLACGLFSDSLLFGFISLNFEAWNPKHSKDYRMYLHVWLSTSQVPGTSTSGKVPWFSKRSLSWYLKSGNTDL